MAFVDLLPLLLDAGAGSAFVNPAAKFTGELYRHELQTSAGRGPAPRGTRRRPGRIGRVRLSQAEPAGLVVTAVLVAALTRTLT